MRINRVSCTTLSLTTPTGNFTGIGQNFYLWSLRLIPKSMHVLWIQFSICANITHNDNSNILHARTYSAYVHYDTSTESRPSIRLCQPSNATVYAHLISRVHRVQHHQIRVGRLHHRNIRRQAQPHLEQADGRHAQRSLQHLQ